MWAMNAQARRLEACNLGAGLAGTAQTWVCIIHD